MRFGRGLVFAVLLTAPWCAAATVDFAVAVSLPSLYSRFGVDLQGNILIASNPSACTLPTMNPLYPCGPIWIGKLDASGQKLLFATYLGNGTAASYTTVAGIAADSNGNVIVAAQTTAPDLPTANAIQSTPASPYASLYLAKLSPDGSRLIYGTYLGGSGGQSALSLAVDGDGAAYVAANTSSTDFPTTPESVHEPNPYPTVVAKLSPDGVLQYAATFPVEFYTGVKPIQLDASGGVLLASSLEVLRIAPDGSSLARTPLPLWATPTPTCTSASSSTSVCTGSPWVFARPGGGFQFAGTAASGVPTTVDGLQTFADANGYLRIEGGQVLYPQLLAPVAGFGVDPNDRNRIYAATPNGLFLSEDNGWTWSLLHDGPCLAVAVDPFDSNRLYLSVGALPGSKTGPQLVRSNDRGTHWTIINGSGPGSSPFTSIAADPNVPGLLYATALVLYRSIDGGDHWDLRSVGPSRQNMSPSASTSTSSVSVTVDPTHPGWAYVLGINRCTGFCPVTQNISRTEDGGKTWTNATTTPDPVVSGPGLVSVDPNTGDVIVAAKGYSTTGNQILIYRNGDSAPPDVLFASETTAIAFDPASPGTIYLAVHISTGSGSGYFVIASDDDGATWTPVVQLDRPVYSLAVGAGGVLHASQAPNPPEGFMVLTDTSGAVQYGTNLGGAFTQLNSVASTGARVFLAGRTQGGLPLVDAAQPDLGGGIDGFVAVFNDSGVLLWSTYLGGSADDSVDWVLPLPDGSAVVVGTTNSADFPSLQPSALGTGNTFITHVRP